MSKLTLGRRFFLIMKHVLLGVMLVVLSVSAAFAGATEDLFIATEDGITPEAI